MALLQSNTRLVESTATAQNTGDFYFVSIDGFQENDTEAQNLANPTKSQGKLHFYCKETLNSNKHVIVLVTTF